MNVIQQLKAIGYAPSIKLENINSPTADPQPLLSDEVKQRLVQCPCLFPDYPDEDLGRNPPEEIGRLLQVSEQDAIAIHFAHLRMLEAQTGRGSFPSGCHPDLFSNRHAVKYYIRRSTFNSNYTRPVRDEELSQIWDQRQWQPWNDWRLTREELFDRWAGKPMLDVSIWLVLETYRRVGCWHEETDNEREANIVLLSRPIGGSTIGIGWFNSGTCSSSVESHIDSTWRPSLHGCTNLIAHEWGHNHRLPHTFTNQQSHRGVMSYNTPPIYQGFSTGQAPHTLPRDPSLAQLIRQYGDEWVPFADSPDPPQPPTPDPPPIPDPPPVDIDAIVDRVLAELPTAEQVKQLVLDALPDHFRGPPGPRGADGKDGRDGRNGVDGADGGFSPTQAEYLAKAIGEGNRGFFGAANGLRYLEEALRQLARG